MTEAADGLWQFAARHPEWDEDEDWSPEVNWWAHATDDGLLLIDPLVEDWPALERLTEDNGGCAGIIRTCHWHQRSIADVASRFGAPVWAARSTTDEQFRSYDRELTDGETLTGGVRVIVVARADELALWLPGPSALVFGDAMVRDADGVLRVCPPSWTQPPGGREALLATLREVTGLEPRHVLVSHSGLVTGGGTAALGAALEAA